jgi:DNA polymerase-1
MLMSYVLEGGLHGHGMDELSELHLSHTPDSVQRSHRQGQGQARPFDCVPVKEATKYSAEDADVTLRLYLLLKPQLREKAKRCVYETLERPLVMVLADMERAGSASIPICCASSPTISPSSRRPGKADPQAGGGEFNIGSPKQLGEILFDRMKLEGGRRTKTGAWSTDSDVLEDVAAQGIPIAKKVLDWRGLAKLRGTYTDALPPTSMPRPGGCIRLMPWPRPRPGGWPPPIPICRTFRSAPRKGARSARPFIAAKGNKLISADYSQIELRLLAHIADIPQLKKAFADNLDITP